MDNKLYVLCGIPASGKSTFAEILRKRLGAVVHSSDAIRKELYGSEECQSDPHRVFEIMKERTLDDLGLGKDVVYDATCTKPWERASIVGEVKAAYPEIPIVAVVFTVTLKTALDRNDARERKVPSRVITNMAQGFIKPTAEEGFAAVLTPEQLETRLFLKKQKLWYLHSKSGLEYIVGYGFTAEDVLLKCAETRPEVQLDTDVKNWTAEEFTPETYGGCLLFS